MKINHINLCTSDVPALTNTLVKHFEFEVIQSGKVPEAAKVSEAGSNYSMLRDQNGFYIVVTQVPPSDSSIYPMGFHFAIRLDTPDDVHAKREELTTAGYDAEKVNAFDALGATWTAFYFQAGDGLKIEVNTCSKDIAALTSVP